MPHIDHDVFYPPLVGVIHPPAYVDTDVFRSPRVAAVTTTAHLVDTDTFHVAVIAHKLGPAVRVIDVDQFYQPHVRLGNVLVPAKHTDTDTFRVPVVA